MLSLLIAIVLSRLCIGALPHNILKFTEMAIQTTLATATLLLYHLKVYQFTAGYEYSRSKVYKLNTFKTLQLNSLW